jgi:hypothetical protein
VLDKWVTDFDEDADRAGGEIFNFIMWSCGADKNYVPAGDTLPRVGSRAWEVRAPSMASGPMVPRRL